MVYSNASHGYPWSEPKESQVPMLYLVDVVDKVVAKLIEDLLRFALVWALDEIVLCTFEKP